jgi:hypothetical protein
LSYGPESRADYFAWTEHLTGHFRNAMAPDY